MTERLEVYTADREWPPQAVAYNADAHPDMRLRAKLMAVRLVGARCVFCAKLSGRIGRAVVCTPEFSEFWANQSCDPVPSFRLELLQ